MEPHITTPPALPKRPSSRRVTPWLCDRSNRDDTNGPKLRQMDMHKTRIDIPEDKRRPLVELLNARLADLVDLQTQLKQAHWNVKGPNFIALHELFDAVTDVVRAHSDTVAERAVILGGIAQGTARVASLGSTLPEYPLDAIDGATHVNAVATVLAAAGKHIRASITRAGELGDADTEDLFTEVSRDLDKQLWFVEAHLQAER